MTHRNNNDELRSCLPPNLDKCRQYRYIIPGHVVPRSEVHGVAATRPLAYIVDRRSWNMYRYDNRMIFYDDVNIIFTKKISLQRALSQQQHQFLGHVFVAYIHQVSICLLLLLLQNFCLVIRPPLPLQDRSNGPSVNQSFSICSGNTTAQRPFVVTYEYVHTHPPWNRHRPHR